MRSPRRAAAVVIALLTVITACSSDSSSTRERTGTTRGESSSSEGAPTSSSPSTATAPTAGDWPTYHRTNDRSGAVDGFPKPGSLRSGWKTSLDGAAYGQPIVIGSMVVVATEN